MNEPEKCSIRVPPASGWGRSTPCKRPAKDFNAKGHPVCGVHLGAEKRSIAADEKREARFLAQKNQNEALEARLADLEAKLGIELRAYRQEYGVSSSVWALVRISDLEQLGSDVVIAAWRKASDAPA